LVSPPEAPEVAGNVDDDVAVGCVDDDAESDEPDFNAIDIDRPTDFPNEDAFEETDDDDDDDEDNDGDEVEAEVEEDEEDEVASVLRCARPFITPLAVDMLLNTLLAGLSPPSSVFCVNRE